MRHLSFVSEMVCLLLVAFACIVMGVGVRKGGKEEGRGRQQQHTNVCPRCTIDDDKWWPSASLNIDQPC